MSGKSELIASAKKALSDVRCRGSVVYLESLLIRVNELNQRETPRFTDKDGNPITSVKDIIGLINEDDCYERKVSSTKERYTNSLSGVRLTLTNVIVDIKSRDPSDSQIRFDHGVGKKNLVLVMSYWLDNDKEVPMKINYIDFVDVIE